MECGKNCIVYTKILDVSSIYLFGNFGNLLPTTMSLCSIENGQINKKDKKINKMFMEIVNVTCQYRYRYLHSSYVLKVYNLTHCHSSVGIRVEGQDWCCRT